MGLFKRKKSRQEKIGDSDIHSSIETGVDVSNNETTDDVLSTLADMPITEHLI